MVALTDNLLLKVVSEIHDPVTTTDELIPSGETSSYRSNPLGLAEFTLSRKDPAYVGLAKEVYAQELKRREDAALEDMSEETAAAIKAVRAQFPDANNQNTGIGSTIFAVKPGDGSAREQAASCQKVLGGWANIANEYATKRYRSNLINWGMLPFIIDGEDLPFKNKDYIFIPQIAAAVKEKAENIKAYAVTQGQLKEFNLKLGSLTDDERQIILDGCLINYNRVK
jgi:aconitate hydratase